MALHVLLLALTALASGCATIMESMDEVEFAAPAPTEEGAGAAVDGTTAPATATGLRPAPALGGSAPSSSSEAAVAAGPAFDPMEAETPAMDLVLGVAPEVRALEKLGMMLGPEVSALPRDLEPAFPIEVYGERFARVLPLERHGSGDHRDLLRLEARDLGCDLVLRVERLAGRVMFRGRNKYYLPSLMAWGFAIVPSWFVPDETYGLETAFRVEFIDVRTGWSLATREYRREVRRDLNDFERGWNMFGVLTVPYGLEEYNWRKVAALLGPPLAKDLRSAIARDIDGLFRTELLFERERAGKALEAELRELARLAAEAAKEAQAGHALTPEGRPLRLPDPPVDRGLSRRPVYLLACGVDRYKDPELIEVRGAEDDARRAATLLDSPWGWAGSVHAALLRGVDKEAILQYPRKVIGPSLNDRGGQGTLLVLLFGHATVVPGKDGKPELAYLPADGNTSRAIETSIPFSEIYTWKQATGAKELVVFADLEPGKLLGAAAGMPSRLLPAALPPGVTLHLNLRARGTGAALADSLADAIRWAAPAGESLTVAALHLFLAKRALQLAAASGEKPVEPILVGPGGVVIR